MDYIGKYDLSSI